MIAKLGAAELLPRLDAFDAVIDARSESEFAEDHLPGARNWPTLNDAERALVGTEYKQVSPFTARKRGAALAARNIAAHIERELGETPKDWRPLVYCWRGGQRSGSLATVLGAIGFHVTLLEGGYRAYRRAVISALDEQPPRLDWRVICGTTGSGKSRLLAALATQGAQVLDLEGLANHRGSVLGLAPGERQPSQKAFESRLWDAMRRLDPSRPVFVESESRKVGDLRVPEALIERMRAAPCLVLELPVDARVTLLLDEYRFFVEDIAAFCTRLDALRVLRGHETINHWQAQARAGRVTLVVRELLEQHYDPIYRQSIRRNYGGSAEPRAVIAWDGHPASLERAAARAIANA
jgi:tRNA 2-selenouridine synthase